MKKLRRLECKFDLEQSERKSWQVNASAACKPWPNGAVNRPKVSTSVYLRDHLASTLNNGIISSRFL